jgi:hypothetical protein
METLAKRKVRSIAPADPYTSGCLSNPETKWRSSICASRLSFLLKSL